MTPLLDPNAASDSLRGLIAKILKVLDDRKIEYVFTGSFALAYWVIPRQSKDIDLVLLLDDAPRQREVLAALRSDGFEVADDAANELKRGYHSTAVVGVTSDGSRYVFELLVTKPGEEKLTPRIVRRARQMPVPGLGRTVPVVSPEDLILYKLLVFRKGERPTETDDLKDVSGILATQRDLDLQYVKLSLDHLPLPDDAIAERKRWFAKAVKRFRPRPAPRRKRG